MPTPKPKRFAPTSSRNIWLLAGSLAAAIAIVVLLAPRDADAPSDNARTIEGRLIAPCCFTQTLDIHESESAAALRAEIEQRVAHGEHADSIEQDFETRYGPEVRAVPKGADPRRWLPLVTSLAMLGSALGLYFMLDRWTRRKPVLAGEPAGRRDAYDEKLDAELADLDDAR